MGNVFREQAGGIAPGCEGCGAKVAQAELSFSPDGKQICRRCSASWQVAQADARANQVYGPGAKILNPIGKAAMRNPRAFMRLMVAGALALPLIVMIAVALAFAFGTWLRDLAH